MTLDKEDDGEKKKKYSRKRKRNYGDKSKGRAGPGGLVNRHYVLKHGRNNCEEGRAG